MTGRCFAKANRSGAGSSPQPRPLRGSGLGSLASLLLVMGCGVDAREVTANGASSGGSSAATAGEGSGGTAAGSGGSMQAAFMPDAGVGVACDGGFTCAGDRLLECDAGAFVERETCAQACLESASGAACGGECKPSARSCGAEDVPAVCDDRGEWQPLAACGGATPRCVEGVCRACALGDRRCGAGGAPETCSGDGTWAPGALCSGDTPVCLVETGACAPCAVGEQRDCDPGPEAGSCSRGTQTCEALDGSAETRFGACLASDASDGTSCDDGDAQTVGDSCQLGACDGARLGTLATGPRATCAIRSGGALYCWGALEGIGAVPTPIDLPLPAVSVSVGDAHGCASLSDGSLRCFGSNALGALGNGTDQPVTGTAAVALAGVLQVAAGAAHSAAVTNDGLVYLWGDYTRALGQTELYGPEAPPADTAIVSSPRVVADLGQAVQLGLGFRHVCAILGSGQVVCWGRNDFSQLGRPSLGASDAQAFTALLDGINDAVGIASGDSYSCALRATGAAVCWGSLFTSDLSNTTNLAPAEVPGLADVVQVSVGSSSACALRRDNRVACWGGNASGELGTGSFNGTLIPQTVVGVDGEALGDAVLLGTSGANGGRSVCALRRDRSVVCWGANDGSQLGDGTTTNRSRPVEVQGLPD